jgi:hypothetical protein
MVILGLEKLSKAIKTLVWTTGITKISLVFEIQVPEALNQHKNAKNKRFRMIICGFTPKIEKI